MSRVGDALSTLDLKSSRVEQAIRVCKGSLVNKSSGHVDSLSQLEATSKSGNKRIISS